MIAILHSHLVNRYEEITVKTSAKTIILVLLSTAVAFAESPKQFGAWSIYSANNKKVVLLQSTSNVQGQPGQAKLDVVCRNETLCHRPGAECGDWEKCIVFNWRGPHNPGRIQL